MMRGGHLVACVLGAFQVAANGDVANWHTGAPGAIPAVGGAMDLAGAKNNFSMMTLFAKSGTPKLVPKCTYPIIGLACVSRVYTELATFHLRSDGIVVTETFGTTVAELVSRLDIAVKCASGLTDLGCPSVAGARCDEQTNPAAIVEENGTTPKLA